MNEVNSKEKLIVVYVDFDDTLYIHPFHWCYQEDLQYNLDFGANRYTYDFDYINHALYHKLENLKKYKEKEGIKVILNVLTGCRLSTYYEAKKLFINRWCEKIDNVYSVAAQEEKLPFIEFNNTQLSKEYDIVETIVIDDGGYSTINACENLGYSAYTPIYFEKFVSDGSPKTRIYDAADYM